MQYPGTSPVWEYRARNNAIEEDDCREIRQRAAFRIERSSARLMNPTPSVSRISVALAVKDRVSIRQEAWKNAMKYHNVCEARLRKDVSCLPRASETSPQHEPIRLLPGAHGNARSIAPSSPARLWQCQSLVDWSFHQCPAAFRTDMRSLHLILLIPCTREAWRAEGPASRLKVLSPLSTARTARS